jgi:hypothetical protein
MKKCSKCKIEKGLNLDNFYWQKDNNKWRDQCKMCMTNDQAQYREDHKEEIKEYKTQYREDHKEEIKEYKTQYREDHKEEIKEYLKKRRKTDPIFKLRDNVSGSIYKALKRSSSSKRGESCMNHLPYTIEQLWDHLESKFEPWMTRENQGVYNSKTYDPNDSSTWTWHLDHIKPHSSFPYSSMEDQAFKDCWALSNLRPLKAIDNMIKGSK